MTKSSVAVVARGNGRGAEGTGNGTGSPMCKNCHTLTTPLWRRNEHGAVLCNACGLFLKLHGRSRPISLKTDVIKSRNRKSSHANSGAAGDSPSAEYRKKENKKRKTQSSRELHAAETLETLMRNDAGSANAVAPVAAAAAAGSASSATEPAPAASSGPGSVGSSSGTNSGSNAKPTISHAWRKILPLNQTQPTSSSNSQTQPVNHSQAQPANQGQPQNSMPRTGGGLPHLSMLLGSVNSSIPHSNFPPRPDEQPSLQPSSLDPEILDDKQQQQQTSSSGPPSRPSATAPQLPSQFPNRTMPSANNVNSNSPLPPALPLTSSALARQDHEQTQPLHMASINEILNNQKPKSEKSLSAVGSPNLHPNFPSAPAPHINTPNIKPLASNVNGAQAGPMRRYSSEYGASGAPRQMQTNSHYSTSPPPIDLHQNLPSAAPYTSSTRSLVPQSQKHQRQASSEIPTTTSSDDERRRNEDNENTQFRLQLRQQRDQQNNAQLHDLRVSRPSSNESLQMQPPLMKLLQSQEEVIKLKTRISELELVTDLYKRHIFELDAKCRSLEERLG